MRQPRAVTWLPGLLLLAVSSLRGADGVDDTAIKYLLRAELLLKKKEEEERKQELADEALDDKLDAEMDALMAIGLERLTSRQQARLSVIIREAGGAGREEEEEKDDEEEEEEEEEADASYLLSSWPRLSSTAAVACSCVSLRHVVDVPVVRFVQFPQVQRRDLRRQLLLLPVQVEGQGSQRAVGGVSVRRQDHRGGP